MPTHKTGTLQIPGGRKLASNITYSRLCTYYVNKCMHTHTYACTHAHTCIHTLTLTHIHTHMHTHMHTHKHTHTHTHAHTHIHSLTYVHTRAHMHYFCIIHNTPYVLPMYSLCTSYVQMQPQPMSLQYCQVWENMLIFQVPTSQ